MFLIGQGLSENTSRRAIGRARQFFRAALKRQFVSANPFDGIAASVKANPERFHVVSRDVAVRVLDAYPDAEWRLIFALARFGGLRCPSEILALTWDDVNWEQGRMSITSSKTEHYEGKGTRVIPIFSELRSHLLEAFEQAEPGAQHVINRYRSTNTNLRTQLHRIIRRAGLEPWPKPFQNLRSTRETELVEQYPMHVVCKWIGNSQPVATEHYLQLTDEHFDRAVRGDNGAHEEAAQNAAQKMHETARNDSQHGLNDSAQVPEVSSTCDDVPVVAKDCERSPTPSTGLEPVTCGLEDSEGLHAEKLAQLVLQAG